MPHITVKGIEKAKLEAFCTELKEGFVKVAKTDEEYVKIFFSPRVRVDASQDVAVDVYWMHRNQELCDAVSSYLTTYFQNKGYGFVQVTFTEFEGNLFYENGNHY